MRSQYVNNDQLGFNLAAVGKGAGIGATAGSVVPGIGTAIGAGVGAVGGAIASLFGSNHHKRYSNNVKRAYAKSGVTLFDEAGWSGLQKTYGVGTHNTTGVKDNWISSLVVPKGFVATLYMDKNERGGSKRYTAGAYDYVGGKYNDHFDSIRVQRVGIVRRTASNVVDNVENAVNNVNNQQTDKQPASQPSSSDHNLLWPIIIGGGVIGVGGMILANSKK